MEKLRFQSCAKSFRDSCSAASIVSDYAVYKKNEVVHPHLQQLIHLLEVLPISLVECERGFSQMNLNHTSQRNRLLTLQ
jgi:hypothetical protein